MFTEQYLMASIEYSTPFKVYHKVYNVSLWPYVLQQELFLDTFFTNNVGTIFFLSDQ